MIVPLDRDHDPNTRYTDTYIKLVFLLDIRIYYAAHGIKVDRHLGHVVPGEGERLLDGAVEGAGQQKGDCVLRCGQVPGPSRRASARS
jgi:hypothetical protein